MSLTSSYGPLSGLRVLEIGHFVAAPFCTRLLGDLGADVIKIEPPGGDPVRGWGEQVNGKSLWWSVHGRNKRSVVLDLRAPAAKAIVVGLAAKSDACVENLRPGQLSRMGIGPSELRAARSDLVIAHISGFGQDGPHRDRAAFGVIGEAIGGLRHLTDHPPGTSSLPPVRAGVSVGDSIAGLYAAFGVLAALWQRDRVGGDARGRTLDVALTDSVLSLMEGMLPEYGALAKIRQPSGSRIPTAAPSSAYRTSEGKWIVLAANSEPLFRKLTELMESPALSQDPRFSSNRNRVTNAAILDDIISEWTSRLPIIELERRLIEAGIPCTKIYNAADCAADPQFQHRGMVRTVEDPQLGFVLQPGIVPHVPDNPGAIRWAGPPVGSHTDSVLTDLLGFDQERITKLRAEGVIQ